MPLNLREVGSLALLVPGTVNTTGALAGYGRREWIRLQRLRLQPDPGEAREAISC